MRMAREEWEPGELVTVVKEGRKKLDPTAMGPFRVRERKGPNAVIEVEGERMEVHANRRRVRRHEGSTGFTPLALQAIRTLHREGGGEKRKRRDHRGRERERKEKGREREREKRRREREGKREKEGRKKNEREKEGERERRER